MSQVTSKYSKHTTVNNEYSWTNYQFKMPLPTNLVLLINFCAVTTIYQRVLRIRLRIIPRSCVRILICRQMESWIRIPDSHQSENQDSNPDLHQSEKV
jgi:hypothetical protein